MSQVRWAERRGALHSLRGRVAFPPHSAAKSPCCRREPLAIVAAMPIEERLSIRRFRTPKGIGGGRGKGSSIRLLGLAIAFYVSTGCSSHRSSAAELLEIARVDSLRLQVSREIDTARAEEERWRSGLLGTLASVRRRILQNTDAMLQQRIEALKAGARFSYTVPVYTPDSATALSIQHEIDSKRAE